MNAITRPGMRWFRLLAWLGAGARSVIAGARSVIAGARSVIAGARSVIAGTRSVIAGTRLVMADARRHRLVFAAILTMMGAIWALALTRVFIHHMPVLPILFNWTPSLPYRIVLVDHRPAPLVRGDLIVYAFNGEAAQRDYPGLKRQPFFKRIAGVAGDVVTVDGRDVFINGQQVGRAKTHTFDRRPLDPIAPTTVLPGQVYVQGSSADSFDSRYRSSGLVRTVDVVARVLPLL